MLKKCSKNARNICCLAQKLLEIYAARLGSARIFLENELLENARLEFYFPCSKSPSIGLLKNKLSRTSGILISIFQLPLQYVRLIPFIMFKVAKKTIYNYKALKAKALKM